MESSTPGSAEPTSRSGSQKLLVVASEDVVSDNLLDEIRPHIGGEPAEILLVAPALTATRFEHFMGSIDDGIAHAETTIAEWRSQLERDGLQLRAQIGDADPIQAIRDALQTFDPDRILLVTHTKDESRWMEDDMFDRAKQEFEPEIVHVAVTPSGGIGDVEQDGPGKHPDPDADLDPPSDNFPKMSSRDIGGIVVALIGTLILIILAGTCEGAEVQRDGGAGSGGTDAGCVVRYLIAGAFALVNIAHVVGLLFFESVGYRGFFEKLFARLSLYGTPAAIVVSLLVG